jgi:hypothetical protein
MKLVKIPEELEMDITYASGVDPFQFVNFDDYRDIIKCSR